MRNSVFASMSVVLVLSLFAGCESKPKSIDEAREYVVGTWQVEYGNESWGKMVNTFVINEDGTYTATSTFLDQDEAPDHVFSGRWEVVAEADPLGPDKNIEDTFKIVFESGFPTMTCTLVEGGIQTPKGILEKKH